MAEHRVPMMGPALHRTPDPERSRDPRVRALVGQLRTLEPAPAPRPEFRAELRAQLVAITPRIVAEGDPAASVRRRPSPGPLPAVAAAKPRRSFRATLSRIGHVNVGKPVAILTCVVAVFALLLGGAVYISRNALPGDTLYGLKRAGENVEKAMTNGDAARAKLLLDFADNRYAEVQDLLPDSGTPDAHTASLITSTLADANSDVKQAMQAMGLQAIKTSSGKSYGLLLDWAGSPRAQLAKSAAATPTGKLRKSLTGSVGVLTTAQGRAHAVYKLGNCSCLRSAPTDVWGVQPCTKCSSSLPAPAIPPATSPSAKAPSAKSPTRSTAPKASTSPATTSPAQNAPPTTSAPPSSAPPSSGTSSSSGGTGILPVLPSLPGVSASGSGDSCQGVDLGLLSIGACGIKVGS